MKPKRSGKLKGIYLQPYEEELFIPKGTVNVSERLKELLLKGWMFEKQSRGELIISEKGEVENPTKAFYGSFARDLNGGVPVWDAYL